MAILTFVRNGKSDIIVFDATVRQAPVFDTEVTPHPVETGADVSDHIRVKPVTLTLDVLVNDQPLQQTRQDFNLTVTGDGRSRDTLYTFELLQREGLLCSIDTGLRSYENMVLKTVTPKIDASISKALSATLQFVELLVVDSITVDIVRPRRTGNKEKEVKNGGKEATKPVDRASGVFKVAAKGFSLLGVSTE